MTATSSLILTSQSTSTYVSLCIILKEPQIAESSYCPIIYCGLQRENLSSGKAWPPANQ